MDLIIKTFQNIDTDNEGKSIQSPADFKNEMLIITSVDDHFQLWREFITKHRTGASYDPDGGDLFNKKPNFKVGKTFQLARSFFSRKKNLVEM